MSNNRKYVPMNLALQLSGNARMQGSDGGTIYLSGQESILGFHAGKQELINQFKKEKVWDYVDPEQAPPGNVNDPDFDPDEIRENVFTLTEPTVAEAVDEKIQKSLDNWLGVPEMYLVTDPIVPGDPVRVPGFYQRNQVSINTPAITTAAARPRLLSELEMSMLKKKLEIMETRTGLMRDLERSIVTYEKKSKEHSEKVAVLLRLFESSISSSLRQAYQEELKEEKFRTVWIKILRRYNVEGSSAQDIARILLTAATSFTYDLSKDIEGNVNLLQGLRRISIEMFPDDERKHISEDLMKTMFTKSIYQDLNENSSSRDERWLCRYIHEERVRNMEWNELIADMKKESTLYLLRFSQKPLSNAKGGLRGIHDADDHEDDERDKRRFNKSKNNRFNNKKKSGHQVNQVALQAQVKPPTKSSFKSFEQKRNCDGCGR